jgi:hypothetical protein
VLDLSGYVVKSRMQFQSHGFLYEFWILPRWIGVVLIIEIGAPLEKAVNQGRRLFFVVDALFELKASSLRDAFQT